MLALASSHFVQRNWRWSQTQTIKMVLHVVIYKHSFGKRSQNKFNCTVCCMSLWSVVSLVHNLVACEPCFNLMSNLFFFCIFKINTVVFSLITFYWFYHTADFSHRMATFPIIVACENILQVYWAYQYSIKVKIEFLDWNVSGACCFSLTVLAEK